VSDAVDEQTDPDQTDRSDATSSDDSSMPAEAAEHEPTELGDIDVVGIEADLDGVQAALTRLADGTYWTDEVSGEPIPAEVLATDPLARRA